jgi:type II secretory pathway component PulF
MANKFLEKMKFGISARISLYERLADFLDNKFPVEETLETIGMRYTKRKDYRAGIITDWRRKMAIGQKFSDAIKMHVPSEERVLISAGESSGGGLPQGLREAIRLSKSMASIKNTIIAGAAYPLVLIMMILGMAAMFYLQMVPVFKNILPIQYWPDSGKTLYSVSRFVVEQWYVVAAVLFGSFFSVSWLMPRWIGPGRSFFDKIPPFSVYKDYQASSFLIALSSMMIAGISLNDSLKKVQEKGSPWLKDHINRMLRKLRVSGSDYGKALDTGLLDDETAGDIQDYARLSTFEKAVYSIGEKTLVKTVKSIEAKMGVIRYLMMFMAAGMIMWIFGTAYLLQQEIADKVGNNQSQAMKSIK